MSIKCDSYPPPSGGLLQIGPCAYIAPDHVVAMYRSDGQTSLVIRIEQHGYINLKGGELYATVCETMQRINKARSKEQDMLRDTLIAIVFTVGLFTIIGVGVYFAEAAACKQVSGQRTGTEYHDYNFLSGCWLRLDGGAVVNMKELRKED